MRLSLSLVSSIESKRPVHIEISAQGQAIKLTHRIVCHFGLKKRKSLRESKALVVNPVYWEYLGPV